MSALALLALAACSPEGEVICELEVAEGSYCAATPAGWDGTSPVDAVMMLHGYGGSPDQYTGKDSVRGAFSDMGVLLIAPAGLDQTWSSSGSPEEAGAARDDVAFLVSVWEDAAARWPVERRFVLGFSLGASMAADLAVREPGLIAAAGVMNGGFWEPLPDTCPAEPAPIAYTAGTADETWPIEGRSMGIGPVQYTQASLEDNLGYWRRCMGCSELSERSEDGPLSCETWSDCEGGVSLRSCRHDGGHERLEGWEERQVRWLLEAGG